MAKFKVHLKLTGLELEIEGSRDDIPLLAENLQRQVGALLNPTGTLITGEVEQIPPPQFESPQSNKKNKSRKRTASSTASKNNSTTNNSGAAIDFKHDSNAWGVPLQTWNTANKSVWLLYVVSKQANKDELSDSEISSTFNKHFKQSGAILRGNVRRDLGKLKSKQSPPVSENTVESPTRWYLNQSGITLAEELVKEARGPKKE